MMPESSWGGRLLVLLLVALPLLAITSDLSSGPMRAFTVLPYLFATLGCYWTRSTRAVIWVSSASLLLLGIGTYQKGADQLLFYMNRGQFALTIVICAFITRQAITSRLTMVRESLATVLAELSVGLAIFAKDGGLTFANAAFINVWGKSDSGDLDAMDLQGVLYGLPTSGQVGEIKTWLDGPISSRGSTRGSLELRFTDGRFYQLHAQRLENGQLALMFHDISPLKTYQAQAIQASKLALLGELATSLAHEINQPLAAIQLTADNMQRHLEVNDAPDRDFLTEKTSRAMVALDRARKIIDHLRRFGRNAKEPPTAVDINEAINSAVDLVSNQFIGAGIAVDLHLPEDKIYVMGHPIQLEQVILNLLANARDVLAEGIAQPRIAITLRDLGDTVRLRISDNGPGVPEDIQSSIFQPFYTTKEVGKGTGLGLSVSRGIVAEFGGSLELESSSHGATFILTFRTENRSRHAA